MREEIWEATAAFMGDFDTMRVEIIDVQAIVDEPNPIASNG